jgi:hypothetical protein
VLGAVLVDGVVIFELGKVLVVGVVTLVLGKVLVVGEVTLVLGAVYALLVLVEGEVDVDELGVNGNLSFGYFS